jgi:hypothetical protein
LVIDITPQKEIQQTDFQQMQRPRDFSIVLNPTICEAIHEGFSNVQTPVWGSPILLTDDVWLQTHCLEV